MPLYLISTKGKDDHKLVKATSAKAAEDAFLGRPELESRTITDAAEGAELAAKYEFISAMETSAPAAAKPATEPKTDTPEKGAGGEEE